MICTDIRIEYEYLCEFKIGTHSLILRGGQSTGAMSTKNMNRRAKEGSLAQLYDQSHPSSTPRQPPSTPGQPPSPPIMAPVPKPGTANLIRSVEIGNEDSA